MPVPQIYRRSSETPITTTDLNTFISNTGAVKFHGGKSANEYILTGNAFYSNNDNRNTRPGGNTANDIDFDAPVMKAITIEGDAIVTIPILHVLAAGGSSPVSTTLTATLYKVSGGVETQIGTANTTASATMSSGEMTWRLWTLSFSCTRTNLRNGDFIRLNVQTTAPGANEEIVIAHDPAARTGSTTNSLGVSSLVGNALDTSDLHVYVPFRTQL